MKKSTHVIMLVFALVALFTSHVSVAAQSGDVAIFVDELTTSSLQSLDNNDDTDEPVLTANTPARSVRLKSVTFSFTLFNPVLNAIFHEARAPPVA